jgi:formate--tetrahydrofolate ligase
MHGLWPAAVVLVVTARAMRFHGGDAPGLASIEKGFENVARHLASIRSFGLTPIVAINTFPTDTAEEHALIAKLCASKDVACAKSEGFAKGGAGTEALADLVADAVKKPVSAPKHPYALDAPAEEKIRAVATTIYGAKGIELTPDAKKGLEKARAWGFGDWPICMAKTHMSLSDDPTLPGAPTGFTVTVREIRVSAGAGFLLALTGEILTMPGLPKVPAAYGLELSSDGNVTGVH